jgi:GNAT superfamily N-acetyltransferase
MVKLSLVSSPADAADLDALLWDVLWQPLGLPRDCRHTFALAGDETELIAREGERIVGGLVAVRSGGALIEIRHLAVDLPFQGRGIGQALIHELENMARQRSFVRLRTIARNTTVGFFMRQGFAPVAEPPPDHPVFRKHRISFIILEKRIHEHAGADGIDPEPGRRAVLREHPGDPTAFGNGSARLTPRPWRTVAEADAWAAQAQAGLSINAAEREALAAYQDRSTGTRDRLTAWLHRGGQALDRGTRALADRIDAIIGRSCTAVNGFTYRCLDLAACDLYYFDRAYMSTTLCGAIAWRRHGIKAESPVLLKIHLPRGTRGVYLPLLTGANPDLDGAEFLLQRGTMLSYVSERDSELDGRPFREITISVVQGTLSALEWSPPTLGH